MPSRTENQMFGNTRVLRSLNKDTQMEAGAQVPAFDRNDRRQFAVYAKALTESGAASLWEIDFGLAVGSGAYGHVYGAWPRTTRIRRGASPHVAKVADLSTIEDYNHFCNEGQILQAASNHDPPLSPTCVEYRVAKHSAYPSESSPWIGVIVMERWSGSLHGLFLDMLNAIAPLAYQYPSAEMARREDLTCMLFVSWCSERINQILSALAKQCIMHNDAKPSNFLYKPVCDLRAIMMSFVNQRIGVDEMRAMNPIKLALCDFGLSCAYTNDMRPASLTRRKLRHHERPLLLLDKVFATHHFNTMMDGILGRRAVYRFSLLSISTVDMFTKQYSEADVWDTGASWPCRHSHPR